MVTLMIMSGTCFARWYQKQLPYSLVGDLNDDSDAGGDIDIGASNAECGLSVF